MTRTLLGGALLALLMTTAGAVPAEAGPRRFNWDRFEDRLRAGQDDADTGHVPRLAVDVD